jgi:hypothetical protein
VGLTEFTFSRFLVPWLCDYTGAAIFMDADIVVTGDIGELVDQLNPDCSVQVMQGQAKFEWASVMLFNCAKCTILTPEFVADESHNPLALGWGNVGNFSAEWNHCVGYADPKPAKLYHYTQGIPYWHESRGLPEDTYWDVEFKELTRTVPWVELMGKSVHARPVLTRLMRGYGIQVD